MTVRRKLLLGFALMVVPALLIGGEAIRTNVQERRALQALGENMARTRTYAELETAMFNESQVVWRYLSGMDPTARRDFDANREVVTYWQGRWRQALRPGESELADGVDGIQREIVLVSDSVFLLYDAGHHTEAYQLARVELRDRLLPALTDVNRDVYRRARESSVRGAYARLEDILAGEDRVLIGILVLALGLGTFTSWLIARSIAEPISELGKGMAVVGGGKLDHPIHVRSNDEVGDLARAFSDMTEKLRESRSELESKMAQLQQTQRQLVQAERLASIGEMSAAVAHGLRNPLASLRAAAQLALKRTKDADSRENLQDIIYEADRLDKRVTHLLDFSRPAPFHPLVDSVSRIVQDVVQPFRPLAEERRVKIEVDLAPALPDVRVDPVQIEQALVEILSNALDAMPDGGDLRVAARRDPGNGSLGSVAIEVSDTGTGIPDDVLPSVCEPFFTTRQGGTGLGLATAKRYVEQNGGQLDIESGASRPGGRGTAVRVRLEAAAAPASGVDAASPPPVGIS